ncbi:MAG: hypothetical protein QXL94_07595 [Candidatus Parvarchaeum sp.]
MEAVSKDIVADKTKIVKKASKLSGRDLLSEYCGKIYRQVYSEILLSKGDKNEKN